MNVKILNLYISADRFSPKYLAHQSMLHQLLVEASKAEIRPPYPLKEFVPKFKLPVLERYDIPAPRNYWSHWPKNYQLEQDSKINYDLFRELAIDAGFEDRELLEIVYSDLKFGAKIGCKGKFRNPTKSNNAPSAFEFGDRVSDSICEWLEAGYASGPFELDELPRNAKISGLMVKLKPTGKARLILNLSAPKGSCVNEGIDKTEYPAKMTSTLKFVRIMTKCGRNCQFTKVDWAAAYKQIRVHETDHPLQYFEWLGRYFLELCLIFGGVSSVGIYDRFAKIVLFIVLVQSGMPPSLVVQQIDDVVACGPPDGKLVELFDKTYFYVASRIGVELAPRDDPEKSFSPTTRGQVLGVWYDSKSWTWWISDEKITIILNMLKDLILTDKCEQWVLWKICGKLINIMVVIPPGKFNIDQIIIANSVFTDKSDRKEMVQLWPELKDQLRWWILFLQMCNKKMPIPDLDEKAPVWAIPIWSDAAGGSLVSHGHGAGCVIFPTFWTYAPWGKRINSGRVFEGKRLDRKLSALELSGQLIGICAGSHILRNQTAVGRVDNAGSVRIFEKGYSTSCKLSNTLVKTIHQVTMGLNIRYFMEKVTRCTTDGAIAADAISKSDWCRLRRHMPEHTERPAKVPEALLDWIHNPCEDLLLGQKILNEMAKECLIVSYNC